MAPGAQSFTVLGARRSRVLRVLTLRSLNLDHESAVFSWAFLLIRNRSRRVVEEIPIGRGGEGSPYCDPLPRVNIFGFPRVRSAIDENFLGLAGCWGQRRLERADWDCPIFSELAPCLIADDRSNRAMSHVVLAGQGVA